MNFARILFGFEAISKCSDNSFSSVILKDLIGWGNLGTSAGKKIKISVDPELLREIQKENPPDTSRQISPSKFPALNPNSTQFRQQNLIPCHFLHPLDPCFGEIEDDFLNRINSSPLDKTLASYFTKKS